MCAFVITNIRQAAKVFVADIEATADADVGPLDVPHGLGSIPLDVTLTELQVEAWTSTFVVSGVDAVNVELTKVNAVGSGVAGDQIRVVARLDAYRER
jgi:hypothetical protein